MRTWKRAANRERNRTLPAPNKRQHDARTFDMAQLKLRKEIVVFVPLLLPQRIGRLIAAKTTAVFAETLCAMPLSIETEYAIL